MKKLLLVSMFVFLALGFTQQAKADFMVDPAPGGLSLYIDIANKDASSFTGYVGGNSNTFPAVSVKTQGLVDTGSGYANIKPVKDGTLTDLIFTPSKPLLFGDFSFRGQLAAVGDITVKVWDSPSDFQSFTFSIGNAKQDFDRIGIVAVQGSLETIFKVQILGGFDEVKQINFSNATPGGPGTSVPEPGTLLLLGFGLLGLVGVARRRMK